MTIMTDIGITIEWDDSVAPEAPDDTYNQMTREEVWELAADAFLESGAQYECVSQEDWEERWVAERYPYAL